MHMSRFFHRVSVHVSVSVYQGVYVCMHVCICVYTYMCVHIYIYTYIYKDAWRVPKRRKDPLFVLLWTYLHAQHTNTHIHAHRNSLFVDQTDLPLDESYGDFDDFLGNAVLQGDPAEGGLYFPWATNPNGGMVVSNITFVNFKFSCLRGCAHCGRAGSPVLGDGGWETRFEKMRFVNSTQRAWFRHPNEGVCVCVCACMLSL